ncbi:MAG: hypothetical protein LLF89_10660 [Spirochaetaceae bacterium]|nr:hypothetical protein [Spirochaetaceae bacterium]
MEDDRGVGGTRKQGQVITCQWPSKFSNPKVDLLARRLRKVFLSLPHLGYLGQSELYDYAYYERIILKALVGIDMKASRGLITPLDTRDYPKIVRYPNGVARVALYIGTFDPFQLTHLAIVLRMLASPQCQSDIVIVVPEGSADARKPQKTDYPFRFQIVKMQLAGIFDPFVIPLDIGAGADTIEIVRRFIALHTGMKLELTHLLGSDALPMASSYIEQDLQVWGKEAQQSGVDFSHSMYVARREKSGVLRPCLEHIRKQGVPVYLDPCVIGTPSSTEFRRDRAITLVLPTEDIRDKLEVLFRYNMNQPWSANRIGQGQRSGKPSG